MLAAYLVKITQSELVTEIAKIVCFKKVVKNIFNYAFDSIVQVLVENKEVRMTELL